MEPLALIVFAIIIGLILIAIIVPQIQKRRQKAEEG
jgi:type II secretory pathway component PulF